MIKSSGGGSSATRDSKEVAAYSQDKPHFYIVVTPTDDGGYKVTDSGTATLSEINNITEKLPSNHYLTCEPVEDQ